jgi:type III secretory pathway component EscT
MTANYQKKRQRIGGVMLFLNFAAVTIYRRYEHLIPDGILKTYLPVILIMLIGAMGFYFIYRISSKDQRLAIIVLPLTLLILFLFSLLK